MRRAITGWFGRLIDSHFRRLESGETAFYPRWSARAGVLVDTDTERRLRRYLWLFYILVLTGWWWMDWFVTPLMQLFIPGTPGWLIGSTPVWLAVIVTYPLVIRRIIQSGRPATAVSTTPPPMTKQQELAALNPLTAQFTLQFAGCLLLGIFAFIALLLVMLFAARH